MMKFSVFNPVNKALCISNKYCSFHVHWFLQTQTSQAQNVAQIYDKKEFSHFSQNYNLASSYFNETYHDKYDYII